MPRSTLAYQRGQAGDPAAAVAGLLAVAVDMADFYGTLDRRALSARNRAGYWMGKAGHPDEADRLLEPLPADAHRVPTLDDRMMFDVRAQPRLLAGRSGRSGMCHGGFTSTSS